MFISVYLIRVQVEYELLILMFHVLLKIKLLYHYVIIKYIKYFTMKTFSRDAIVSVWRCTSALLQLSIMRGE